MRAWLVANGFRLVHTNAGSSGSTQIRIEAWACDGRATVALYVRWLEINGRTFHAWNVLTDAIANYQLATFVRSL